MKQSRTAVDFDAWDHPIKVASKIVSKSLGACQRINDVVFVNLPKKLYEPKNPYALSINRAGPEMFAAMVDAFKRVRDDIKGFRNNKRGKAFINVSYGFDGVELGVTSKMIQSMTAAVQGVTEQDALVFVAAPYSLGENQKIGYPSLLGKENPRVVVVGMTDVNGNPNRKVPSAPFIKINAVGSWTNVTGRLQSDPNKVGQMVVTGTSFSKSISSPHPPSRRNG